MSLIETIMLGIMFLQLILMHYEASGGCAGSSAGTFNFVLTLRLRRLSSFDEPSPPLPFETVSSAVRPTNRATAMPVCAENGIRLLSVGSILELRKVISLRCSFYGGWCNIKILAFGECRRVHDCYRVRVNDCEVFI